MRTRADQPPEAVTPPTENALAGTPMLDQLSSIEIVTAMNEVDRRVADAVAAEKQTIAAAIDAAARAIAAGGRLVYVGAGTSGRLGVLDAAECPPTFGVSPDRVVALIAGGDAALRQSCEGAEDDCAQAERDLEDLAPPLTGKDFVVGISASGLTPYTRAALRYAQARNIPTALVCCNPACRDAAPVVIAMDTGGEALPGSTRLKAGTATKMALNMISTGAMARAGLVYRGLMVGARPVSRKLRRRAVRIVAALTEWAEDHAQDALDRAAGRIPVAVLMLKKEIGAGEAEQRLAGAGGALRDALDED